MKIPKEEYRKVIKCLKNYKYNEMQKNEIEADILAINISPADSPRTSSGISDTVFNKVMQLQQDEDLQRCIKEYKAVERMLLLVDDIAKEIFEEEFKKGNHKWKVIKNLNLTLSTYERRKRELVYTTYRELKKVEKIDGILTVF